MFPGAHAQIYRNEAGEPVGWDYPPDLDIHDDGSDYYDRSIWWDDDEEGDNENDPA